MLGRLLLLSAARTVRSAVHSIKVGASDHRFQPDTIAAALGDTISFQFYPTNHSVVRMDQNWPCKPYELVNLKDAAGGWWSNFHPVSEFLDPAPSWNLTVTTADPQYFYCSAPSSCIYYGMIGVINPNNSSLPLSTVANKAGQTDYSLSPGESWLAEAPTRAPPKPALTLTLTPTPTPPNSTASGSSESRAAAISTGAIVGIVLGGIAALVLIGLLFYFVGHKRKDPPPDDDAEHPPGYSDPRYAQPHASSPKERYPPVLAVAAAHPTMVSAHRQHRISELPAAYDPVEIYTPETGCEEPP